MKLKIALVLLLIAEQLLLPLLRSSPSNITWRRLVNNLGLSLNNLFLVVPFITAPMMLWATSFQLWHRPAWIPAAGLAIVDVLFLDFYSYAYHYALHKHSALWRFHAVHHLDEKMDMSTTLRSHPVERILSKAIRCALVIVFAIPLSHVVLSEIFTFCLGPFHHNEAIKVPAWIENSFGWLITMPSFHAVHHTSELPYTDSNYSFELCIWDHIFGTSLLRRPLPGMKRGLDKVKDLPLGRLITEPFAAAPCFIGQGNSEEPVEPSLWSPHINPPV